MKLEQMRMTRNRDQKIVDGQELKAFQWHSLGGKELFNFRPRWNYFILNNLSVSHC